MDTMEQYFYLIGEGENPEGGQQGMPPGPGMSFLVPFILIFFVFYFLVLRPQSKDREAMIKAQNKLEKNDKVLTSSGIYGFVVSVKEGEDELVIKTGDQEPASRLTISKSTVVRIFRPNDPNQPEKK